MTTNSSDKKTKKVKKEHSPERGWLDLSDAALKRMREEDYVDRIVFD